MATVATKVGKSVMANRMKGEGAEPNIVCWGTNPASATASVTDVALFSESAEARVSGTSSLVTTSVVNDTFQVVGTLTASAGREIKEAALALSTTQPFKTTVEAGSKVIGSESETELKTAANYTPANGTFIQVRGEVMEVSAGTGTKTLTVVRKQNGSTASAAIATSDSVTQGNVPGPYSTIAKAAASAGATLLTHADLSVVNLNTGDSIQWTWQVQFS